MTEVIVRDNESFEAALRRFTRTVQAVRHPLRSPIRREHFEKPSVRRKRKAVARARRAAATADTYRVSATPERQLWRRMSLKDQIAADLKQALKEGDETRKSTLRLLISAVHNVEIEKGAVIDDGGVLGVIAKQIKQRHDSAEEFRRGNRQDLVDKEESEAAILQAYLPPAMSREDDRGGGAQGDRRGRRPGPARHGQGHGAADGAASRPRRWRRDQRRRPRVARPDVIG